MAEYIEREAAVLALLDKGQHSRRYKLGEIWELDFEEIREAIKSIPAADVRPVVRGKWVKELCPNVRYNQYKCSICGEFSGHDSEGWIWEPNYCPNCGAEMRETDDEKA